ncbi:hypothetical protein PoB_002787000 [Plakobranchus ocellatus]|uniref:Uncharacterized protein n=1 Tax=Plakobranchus ocellatus TaxID=259542 RepID=A0AAV4A3A9_9GAST|nr:hypothetical protein PoB_002787000 [Plakobranchus ocellatus]
MASELALRFARTLCCGLDIDSLECTTIPSHNHTQTPLHTCGLTHHSELGLYEKRGVGDKMNSESALRSAGSSLVTGVLA